MYMHKYAQRSRQYSNRSKAAVQVVDMAAIHMVPPTRASTFFDHRYHCTLCISIKAQMTTMHGDGSTPIIRNDCESYLQMCRIKGAFLISRYTAGHGCTNLLLCTESEVVLSNKLFDVSSFQLCNYDYAHIILHLHVTHSSSQYHDNCP